MTGGRSRSSGRIGSGARRSTTTNSRAGGPHWRRQPQRREPASPPSAISSVLMPVNSSAAPEPVHLHARASAAIGG